MIQFAAVGAKVFFLIPRFTPEILIVCAARTVAPFFSLLHKQEQTWNLDFGREGKKTWKVSELFNDIMSGKEQPSFFGYFSLNPVAPPQSSNVSLNTQEWVETLSSMTDDWDASPMTDRIEASFPGQLLWKNFPLFGSYLKPLNWVGGGSSFTCEFCQHVSLDSASNSRGL